MKTPLLLLSFLCLALPAHADIACDQIDDVLISSAHFADVVSQSAFTIMYYTKSSGDDKGGAVCLDDTAITFGNQEFDIMFMGRAGATGELVCMTMWNAASAFTQLSGPMSPGWHHVAFRLLAGTLAIFVDGVSVGSTATANLTSALAQPVELCHATFGTNDHLTEVKIYPGGVSTEEIQRLANRLRSTDRTAPAVYWTLEHTTCGQGASAHGVTFADLSGNNRTITGNSGGSGLTCVGSEFVARPWGVQ